MTSPEGYNFEQSSLETEMSPEDLENEKIVAQNLKWLRREMPIKALAEHEIGDSDFKDGDDGEELKVVTTRGFANIETGEIVDQSKLKKMKPEELDKFSNFNLKVVLSLNTRIKIEENNIAWGPNFSEKAKQIIEGSVEQFNSINI